MQKNVIMILLDIHIQIEIKMLVIGGLRTVTIF